MSNYQSPDPITQFSNLLPEWGQAADEIYQNYHFLDLALRQSDVLLIPQQARNQLVNLKKMLVSTLARLIQDLPPSTHRLSNENAESMSRFNAHIHTLKTVNLQTDTIFEDLLQQHPPLNSWFESTLDE
ncbi:hypothetical protein GCM10028803_32010 [Larkinella knui]|uniref:Uncharacterized protein n=1 Tax=Larkinella knui TaxID=2025310 RepID=A0A3P1CXY0_9BACT|nr:hypothetical protein [Larkinella knui]RRB18221.1 hypothetical protein EHT87_08085 [Larkinella knui]